MLDLKELQDSAYLVSVYNRAIHIPSHFKPFNPNSTGASKANSHVVLISKWVMSEFI